MSEALKRVFKSSADAPRLDKDLFGLTVVVEPQKALTNIVLVHGLGGSAIRSWTHSETQWFWPAGLVESLEFKNARILTYGYDASVSSLRAGSLGISEFAAQLNDALSLFYYESGDVWSQYYNSDARFPPSSSPIVWVG